MYILTNGTDVLESTLEPITFEYGIWNCISNRYSDPEKQFTLTVIPIVPASITNSQARQALELSGLYSSVNTAILSGTDVALQIRWEYEPMINRNDAGLITMATTLSLTALQLDELFILGGDL